MPSQFLCDIQSDITAGVIRVVSADEERQAWLQRAREKQRAHEAHAQEIARRHNYSIADLEAEVVSRSLGSRNTTKARDELCAYQRACAIAMHLTSEETMTISEKIAALCDNTNVPCHVATITVDEARALEFNIDRASTAADDLTIKFDEAQAPVSGGDKRESFVVIRIVPTH